MTLTPTTNAAPPDTWCDTSHDTSRDTSRDTATATGCAARQETALTLACGGGHERMASLLIQRGADVNLPNEDGDSPLMLATR